MPRQRNAKMEAQNTNGHAAVVSPVEDHDANLETARLAYSYWEARGGTHGYADQDWARAEQELRERGR